MLQEYFRLVTLIVIIPRIVLAELNTHRLLSRNSASSRARPIQWMIASVVNNPFVPDWFPRKHKGMQAPDHPDNWVKPGDSEYYDFVAKWLNARDNAVANAIQMEEMGISKQLVNRLLEPFLMHEVILSATEWTNFLALRAERSAQREIRIAAELILDALNESQSNVLQPGEWHLPFGDQIDKEQFESTVSTQKQWDADGLRRIIATARCARVSYRTFDGTDHNYAKDIERYDELVRLGHWSPLEHVARAMYSDEFRQYVHSSPTDIEPGWCGNYRGFVQLRKHYSRNVENRPEPRLTVPT